jgi:pimeloyl-ACP methyl ester carboxylesterase
MRIAAMNVDIVGEGKSSVVLVHGLGGSSSVWWPQVAELRKRHRVLLPEMRGAARSRVDGPLSIEGFVQDLVALLDAQEIKSASFAGHSLGTLILQHFAARHPERVQRLGLIAPVKAPAEARRKVMHDRAAKVRAHGMEALADQILQDSLSTTTREQAPVTVAFVRELILRQDPEGYARSCEASAAATDAEFGKIACPTLIVAGAEDPARPAAEALSREIAGAKRIETLSGAGHWLTLEQPSKVTALLSGFFG